MSLSAQLQQLREQFAQKTSEQLDLKAKADLMERRLTAASKLIAGLSSERTRWTADMQVGHVNCVPFTLPTAYAVTFRCHQQVALCLLCYKRLIAGLAADMNTSLLLSVNSAPHTSMLLLLLSVTMLTDAKIAACITCQALDAKKERLVGDCLLTSSFLSYCGAFTYDFRDAMVYQLWLNDVTERKLPVSSPFR